MIKDIYSCTLGILFMCIHDLPEHQINIVINSNYGFSVDFFTLLVPTNLINSYTVIDVK